MSKFPSVIPISELPLIEIALPVCYDDVAFVARGPARDGNGCGPDSTVLVLGKTGLAFRISLPFNEAAAQWDAYMAIRNREPIDPELRAELFKHIPVLIEWLTRPRNPFATPV